MSDPQTHIVYRSRMDAEIDAFWYDLFTNNPWIWYVIAGVLALAIIAICGRLLWGWVKHLRDLQ